MRIGVFDSGVGGITVLEELLMAFPSEQFVYYGDTAHVPYGSRSPEQIKKLSVACARVLVSKSIDALVIACNTASAHAFQEIREAAPLCHVVGVVEPGVQSVVNTILSLGQDNVPIVVFATRATVRSGIYAKLLRERLHSIGLSGGMVTEQACPLLVPMIEEGWVNHPILSATIAEYVAPFARLRRPGVALLGCTHYPWVKRAFEEALPGWVIVHSGQAVVSEFSAFHEQSIQLQSVSCQASQKEARVEWLFSDPHSVPMFVQARMQQLTK